MIRQFIAMAVGLVVLALASSAAAQDPFPHEVRTTKFTIVDVDESTAFYENLIGLDEVDRFVAEGTLVEPFMGFDDPTRRIGLLRYAEPETVPKSPIPVSVLTVPDLDAVLARFTEADEPFQEFSGEATGGIRIAFVTDPSGNGIELVEAEGPARVAGARLIVDDRAAVEEFFVRVFEVEPGNRIQTDTFDEVFFDFDGGMFVALFEPKDQAPLPKSEHPVVAIYTTQYDILRERVEAGGLGMQEFGDAILLAKDPSGNVVEIVRRPSN